LLFRNVDLKLRTDSGRGEPLPLRYTDAR
jgi:hypothetical protein